MALIRKSELKSLNEQQLKEKLVELRKDMMKINAQIAIGTTLESPRKPRSIKKTIARILMMLAQKKRDKQGQQKPAEETNVRKNKPQEVKKTRQ